jgi:hypothetical protein
MQILRLDDLLRSSVPFCGNPVPYMESQALERRMAGKKQGDNIPIPRGVRNRCLNEYTVPGNGIYDSASTVLY